MHLQAQCPASSDHRISGTSDKLSCQGHLQGECLAIASIRGHPEEACLVHASWLESLK